MAALARLCNIHAGRALTSRVALSSTAARAHVSPDYNVKQADMLKIRNYTSPMFSKDSYITTHGSARDRYAKFPANEPLKWVGVIDFAGLGGFFPTMATPLVCILFGLFCAFWYHYNTCEGQFDSSIQETAKMCGFEYASSRGPFMSSRGNAAAAPGNAAVDTIYGIKQSNPGNIMASCFTREYFNSLSSKDQSRLLQCCSSGLNNPTSELGAYAMNPTDYDDFYSFFKCVLEKYHKVDLSKTKHVNDWNLKGKQGLPADGVLDVSKFGITEPLSMRIRTARNLKKFPLPGAMNEADRKNMELAMKPVFDSLVANPEFGGEYVSLTPGHPNKISDERYQELVKAHIMFKDMSADSFLVDAGIAGDWPFGRGCYVSEDRGFIIWVGEEDHLRIMAMKKSLKINDVFDRLKAAIDVVEDLIPGGCAKSKDFGVITSCPTNMGTGMRASVHIKIPNLTKDGSDETAKTILKPYGLGVRGLGGEHTPIGADGTVDISPKARFCISESEIAIALYKGVEKVIAEETSAGQ